jgi:phage tail protein X
MELNEVREALEGLAAEGEVVIPDNIEVLLKTSSAEVSSDAKGQDARSPKKGARGSTRSKTGNAFAGETRRAPGSQQESNQTEQVEDIEAQVAKLSELVEQWKTLRAGFQPDRFLKEMKKGWNKNALPMNKAGEWLESEMNPKKWDKEKRAFFVENVLRPMEEWVARAETVAKDLHEKSKKASMARRKRKTTAGKSKEAEQKSQPVAVQVLEAEPQAVAPDHRVADPSAAPPAARVEPVDVAAGVHSDSDEADPATTLPLVEDQPVGEAVESKPESNVRELRTGRPITALNDLTQWERMEVAKRNVYRHKLRTLKSEYMGEILRELQKNSLDAADMTESIAQSLRQYLSEAIRITIPDIELTASDTETLVAELMTEDSMIKPE